MLVDHDLHVHTYLSSCCSDREATPANIVARAAEAGLRTLGFADHLWDRSVPGAMDWYVPQDLPRLLETRGRLPGDRRGVRVLVGCETEYCGGGKVGISAAAAEQLDFVLIPVTHFHMKGFVAPADLSEPRDVARLMVRRFNEAVTLGLATGIAHPFVPCGFSDYTDAILAEISGSELLDSFGRAAQAGISIEMSTCMFPGACGTVRDGFHDETFLRVLALARQAGCWFHFASDAHTLEAVGSVTRLEPYARAIGLTRQDILPRLRIAGG